MAEITSTDINALVNELQNFVRTVKSSGSNLYNTTTSTSAGSSKESTREAAAKVIQQKRIAAAYKESTAGILGGTKKIKEFADDLSKAGTVMGVAQKHFSDMFNNMDAKGLEEMSAAFRDNLENQGKYGKVVSRQIESAEDLILAHHRLASGSLDMVQQIKKDRADLKITADEAADRMKNLGYSAEDLGRSNSELEEANVALAKTTVELSTKMGSRLPKTFDLLKKAAGSLTAVFATITPFVNTAQSAARTGTAIEMTAGSFGMSPEELNQLQAEQRQTIQSLNIDFETFNKQIQIGTTGLMSHTGSLKDAIRVNAESMHFAKLMGVDQADFMKGQQDTFKRLNSTLSMTSDQFMELNHQLISTGAVQSQIYKLNKKQRAGYFQDLQNTYEKLKIDGLTHEQSLKMLDVFADIGSKGPTERLKEAAKMQAVLGAMGMGQQGQQAAALMRGGLRNEDDKAKLADILRNANLSISKRMGESFQSELTTSAMIQASGMEKYLGPTSDFADFVTRKGLAIDGALEANKLGSERNNILNLLLKTTNQISSWISGPVLQTLVAIAGIGALSKLTGIFGKFGSLSSLIPKKEIVEGISKSVTGILSKSAGPLAGGFTAYAKYDDIKDRTDLSNIQKTTQVASTGIGAMGGTILGATYGAGLTGPLAPIGALVGGIIGGALGAFAGDKTGEAISSFQTPTSVSEIAKKQSELDNNARMLNYYKDAEADNKEKLELEKERIALNREMLDIQKRTEKNTKDANDRLKRQTEAINKQTDASVIQHEENKRQNNRGYSIEWMRAPRNTGYIN